MVLSRVVIKSDLRFRKFLGAAVKNWKETDYQSGKPVGLLEVLWLKDNVDLN